jgi:hypothetical protein
MDEALVEGHGVLGDDALGVLALGQAAGLPKSISASASGERPRPGTLSS